MRFRFVMGVAALAALAACGQGAGGGYPESSRQAFLTSCKTSGAPGQICDCALKKIEGEFSFAEFTEWNNALEQGREHPISQQALTMTMECGQEYIKSGGQ